MSRRASFFLLPIIYLGYVSLGLPDGTLGVAWPGMQSELQLPFDLAGQMVFVGTLLGMVSSFSSGRVIRRFKTGPVVMVSCLLTGVALVLISQARGAALLLLASIPLGLGSGAVDSSLNGYVARHYSRRHMNWLHACWGIGATCGPVVMTKAIGQGGNWSLGFLIVGGAQLCLSLLFLSSLRLWETQPEIPSGEQKPATERADRGGLPAASLAGWLSAFIFALYVAVEGSTGLWANSVLVLSRKISQDSAGFCVAAYYGSITAGRILVGFAPARWKSRYVISGGVALSLAGAALFLFGRTEHFALPALVMIGLGYAPVFPGLMHEVPRRFVPEAVQTIIGRQGACAYFGAAFAPPVIGWLAVRLGLESIPVLILSGTVLLFLSLHYLEHLTGRAAQPGPSGP